MLFSMSSGARVDCCLETNLFPLTNLRSELERESAFVPGSVSNQVAQFAQLLPSPFEDFRLLGPGWFGASGASASRGVQGWDAVLLGVEWSTGSEETVIFPVVPGARLFGFWALAQVVFSGGGCWFFVFGF